MPTATGKVVVEHVETVLGITGDDNKEVSVAEEVVTEGRFVAEGVTLTGVLVIVTVSDTVVSTACVGEDASVSSKSELDVKVTPAVFRWIAAVLTESSIVLIIAVVSFIEEVEIRFPNPLQVLKKQ